MEVLVGYLASVRDGLKMRMRLFTRNQLRLEQGRQALGDMGLPARALSKAFPARCNGPIDSFAHSNQDCLSSPLQPANAAQISMDFPVKLWMPRKVLLEGSSVNTKRPMYSVVAGPGGVSVGNKIMSSCPLVTQVWVPLGLGVTCSTDPPVFTVSVTPLSELVNTS